MYFFQCEWGLTQGVLPVGCGKISVCMSKPSQLTSFDTRDCRSFLELNSFQLLFSWDSVDEDWLVNKDCCLQLPLQHNSLVQHNRHRINVPVNLAFCLTLSLGKTPIHLNLGKQLISNAWATQDVWAACAAGPGSSRPTLLSCTTPVVPHLQIQGLFFPHHACISWQKKDPKTICG